MTTTNSRRMRGVAAAAVAALGVGLVQATSMAPAAALSTVTTDANVTWNVNDARRPGLDTGSIRNVANSRMEGFGNVFVRVEDDRVRMNEQMLRGFGLKEVTPGNFVSTRSVRLGDVLVTRRIEIDRANDTALFFDTFTNAAPQAQRIEVSFGGSLGYGTAANTRGTVVATSDGDADIEAGDAWAVATTGGNYRPTGVIVGSAAPYAGATVRVGDQQSNPFAVAYRTTGSAANDPGFIHDLALEPGQTRSLAHFVLVGSRGDSTAIVEDTTALAQSPDFGGLTLDELCTLANWDLEVVTGPTACGAAEPLKLPAAAPSTAGTTTVDYDVVGKSIAELQADLRAGVVTSVELTQAYLDRIAAYDQGALGFRAFITVADDALAQAREADRKRAAGADGDLLGIPLSIKDNYDTHDMPTTNGTRALADWRPRTDAWQVAKLREAGAVILGKTNLSEFANSGSWSESGFMQTWNGLYPSKSSFGSSGGSATSVATSMAAGTMGSQTGVSLYAPSTGAGLTMFRGTDGLASTDGILPLTWGQDYGGPIARTVTDLAALLNATSTRTTGNNPADIITARVDNTLRPTDFAAGLDADALRGKVIGYLPGSFASTSVADDTAGPVALAQARAALEAAGATLVEMSGSPSAPPNTVSGNAGAEGWERYIAGHDDFPFADRNGILGSPQNLPYNVSNPSNARGFDDENTEKYLARRDAYKDNAAEWMDRFGVDAVIYPGFISQIGNNDATSAVFSSDRGTGVLTSNVGLPTVLVPLGANDDGQSNSLQIVGKAWTDAEVLAMGYALEQTVDFAPLSQFAPALEYAGPAESAATVTLGRTATAYGKAVRATVRVESSKPVSGRVTVEVAGRSSTGTVVDGIARVQLPAKLPVGEHLVTASFGGDSKVAASTAVARLKVTRATPRVKVALPRKTVKHGAAARVKVQVASPERVQVIVGNGRRVLATARPRPGRTVTVRLPRGLRRGVHTLRVRVAAGPATTAVRSKAIRLRVR